MNAIMDFRRGENASELPGSLLLHDSVEQGSFVSCYGVYILVADIQYVLTVINEHPASCNTSRFQARCLKAQVDQR